MDEVGLRCRAAGLRETMDEAEAAVEELGLPLIIRPAYTLGGTGGGIAYDRDELRAHRASRG